MSDRESASEGRPPFVIDIQIKHGQAAGFWELADRLVALSKAEPGVVRYDVLQDLSDPHKVILMEQFRDDAAVQAHLENLEKHFGPPAEGSGQQAPAQLTRFFAGATLRQVRVR